MDEPGERPVHSLEDAEALLSSLIDLERRSDAGRTRVDLRPVRALLARLGNPQHALSVVHVAGSKGKGSTALLCEAVLSAAGERVGTFTSPHLESWTERFRLCEAPVPGERLARAVERMRPHLNALRRGDAVTRPTFFDATTAVALLLFREARVDRAILEVGLGGRLDSTNVVMPAVACVTHIELEHTERLGGTLEAIAGEKAGVVKRRRPVVVGDLAAEALAVVEDRARALDAPVARLGRDFAVTLLAEDEAGQDLAFEDGALAFRARLSLLGRHQRANAALALACARRLFARDARALAEAAQRAFARAVLPGRLEVLEREPWVVVDSAHTPVSARELARELARRERRRARLLLSVSADKDLDAILELLLPAADELTLTRAEPVRSLDPQAVARAARRLRPRLALRVVPDPILAVRAARSGLARDELLCVAGSVYLAGIARRVLRELPRESGA